MSVKYLHRHILALGKIVKSKIGVEMKEASVGCVSYDSWARNNTHYVGVIAKYNKRGGGVGDALLGCAPIMGGVPLDQYEDLHGPVNQDQVQIHDLVFEDGGRESIVFTSQAYSTHISALLLQYGVSVREWLVCQVTDNTNTMPKVGRLLGVGHVGCKSHALHLCVKDSLKRRDDNDSGGSGGGGSDGNQPHNNHILDTIESVARTMKDVKRQAKAGIILRENTKLAPKIVVKDR